MSAGSGSECCRILRSGDWLEAGEKRVGRTANPFSRHPQGAAGMQSTSMPGEIPFRNRTFSLGSGLQRYGGIHIRSEGHRPFLAKQGLCMLRSSQECYLGRLLD